MLSPDWVLQTRCGKNNETDHFIFKLETNSILTSLILNHSRSTSESINCRFVHNIFALQSPSAFECGTITIRSGNVADLTTESSLDQLVPSDHLFLRFLVKFQNQGS